MNHSDPLVSITETDDPPGIRLRDTLESASFEVGTGVPVTLTSASPDRFVLPVDTAASFEAPRLHIPPGFAVHVRDGDGEHIRELQIGIQQLEQGTYMVCLDGPLKTYFLIDDAHLTIRYAPSEDGTLVELDDTSTLVVGARSRHERPTTELTVPPDPEQMMRAVSVLGSSLKEYTPERSWSSLRGHPPALRLGDELDVPDVFASIPDGVTIRVPATFADVYRVAPLAFYLGATVEPGSDPALRLDRFDYEEPLGRGEDLERSVDDMLARCVVLDSLARMEGYFNNDRVEYERLAGELPFYPPNLYDAPLDEQLMEYFEVPMETLSPYVPQWPTTATLRPVPEDVEYLSPLLDSLSRIHVADELRRPGTGGNDTLVYATTDGLRPGDARLVPGETGRRVEAVIGDATEATVRFVGVDESVLDGLAAVAAGRVDDEKDRRDVRVEPGTTDALSDALATAGAAVHVGCELASDGFVCDDGVLPFETLGDVEASFVSVVSSTSTTGVPLVERGAVTSVTVSPSASARDVGRVFGYLLGGHTVASAAQFADVGGDYWFAGDAARSVFVPPNRAIQLVIDARSVSGDRFELAFRPLWGWKTQVGSVATVDSKFAPSRHVLVGSEMRAEETVTAADVAGILREGDYPVRLDGDVVHDGTDATADWVRTHVARE